jgi:uncharacterized tellurite resistance protein B-like protein
MYNKRLINKKGNKMGIGKMLGLAALGIGAIAAAPFTGGGSILGAATLAGSLAGAGAIAAAGAAGAAGAGVGYVLSKREDEEEAKRKEEDKKNELEIANINQKAKNAENALQQHEKHTNLILALSALGFAMANVDGEISPEEVEELDLFIGGLSSQSYPEHITNQLRKLRTNPPTFNEALKYLKLVESVEYSEIRNLLVVIIESDNSVHPNEKAFLSAFDHYIEKQESQNSNIITENYQEVKNSNNDLDHVLSCKEIHSGKK